MGHGFKKKIRSTRRRQPEFNSLIRRVWGVKDKNPAAADSTNRRIHLHSGAAVRPTGEGSSSHSFQYFIIFYMKIFYEEFDLIASPPGGTLGLPGHLVADERHLALVDLFEEAMERAGS